MSTRKCEDEILGKNGWHSCRNNARFRLTREDRHWPDGLVVCGTHANKWAAKRDKRLIIEEMS